MTSASSSKYKMSTNSTSVPPTLAIASSLGEYEAKSALNSIVGLLCASCQVGHSGGILKGKNLPLSVLYGANL